MVNPVSLALTLLGTVTVLVLLIGGMSGSWRWAWRLFLFGLAFAAVEFALIAFVPAVGAWVTEVRSR